MSKLGEKSLLITVTGKAGSGKDFFIELVQEFLTDHHLYIFAENYYRNCRAYEKESNFNCSFMKFAFADMIKNVFTRNFGYTEANKQEFRKGLQILGTEVGRCYCETLWIDPVLNIITALDENTPARVFAITDCRFENEINCLDFDDNFKKIRILVRGNDHRNLMTDDQISHASEALSNSANPNDFDLIIDNFGTIEELRNKAETFGMLICDFLSQEV